MVLPFSDEHIPAQGVSRPRPRGEYEGFLSFWSPPFLSENDPVKPVQRAMLGLGAATVSAN